MMSAAKSEGKGNKKPRLIYRARTGKDYGTSRGRSELACHQDDYLTEPQRHPLSRLPCHTPTTETPRTRSTPLEAPSRLVVGTASQGDLSAAQLKAELSLLVSVRCLQRHLAKVDWLVYTKIDNTLLFIAANLTGREPKGQGKGILLRADVESIWDSITL